MKNHCQNPDLQDFWDLHDWATITANGQQFTANVQRYAAKWQHVIAQGQTHRSAPTQSHHWHISPNGGLCEMNLCKSRKSLNPVNRGSDVFNPKEETTP